MQSSPLPCYVVPVRQISSSAPSSRTPSACVPPQRKRQSFTPVHNRRYHSSVCLNYYSLDSKLHRMIAHVPTLISAFKFFLKRRHNEIKFLKLAKRNESAGTWMRRRKTGQLPSRSRALCCNCCGDGRSCTAALSF